jgi:uroporphyrinogen-III synthase
MMWILTREPEDNAPLAAELRARGVSSVELPCIERVMREWPQATADVVMITSRTAARVAPPHEAIAALAESTAPELERRGISPVLTASGGVVGLARAVSEKFAGKRVLYVHSAQAAGRDEHTQALTILRAACPLETHVLYDLCMPLGAAMEWRTLQLEDYGLFFASPSAVDNFFALWRGHPRAVPARAACLGASTLAAWRMRKPSDFPDALLTPTGGAAMIAKALL